MNIGVLLLSGLAMIAVAVQGAVTPAGFAIPEADHPFTFPADHGSHPAFKLEWWYVTGHLEAAPQRRFGFQATFFRFGLEPEAADVPMGEPFGHNQLFLAHMALTDTLLGRFLYEERLNREGWDAQAATHDLNLRNGNWSLHRDTNATETVLLLSGSVRAEATFQLTLSPTKPLVRFGTNGVSRKGDAAEAASYYLTFPRLEAEGRLQLPGESLAVRGTAWMDHEISSSQLGTNQVGWDWAGIQLDDGREVMVYVMRTTSGRSDPHSTLAWVESDGTVEHSTAFSWKPVRWWTSPETGGAYPVESELATTDPHRPLRIRLRPYLDAQEIVGRVGRVDYWEGACAVLDPDGKPIGNAYVELTGYARPKEFAERMRR